MPRETSLQPSPEQDAIVAARLADPAGSLRVLAFAGTGKTTALQLLAEADPTPGSTHESLSENGTCKYRVDE
jgi:hypothetical protein